MLLSNCPVDGKENGSMKIHRTQEVESLTTIAEYNNVDIDVLIQANPHIKETNRISHGTKVKIPQQRKSVISAQRKLKSNAKEKKKVHEESNNTRYNPVIKEDDTWQPQPTVKERIQLEKKRHAINHKKENPKKSNPKRHKQKKSGKKQMEGNGYCSLRENPVDKIRNIPYDTIPDVNLLQLIP